MHYNLAPVIADLFEDPLTFSHSLEISICLPISIVIYFCRLRGVLSLAKQLYIFDYLWLSQISSKEFSQVDTVLLLAQIGPYLVWPILFGVLFVYRAPFRILRWLNAQTWLTNPRIRQTLLKITEKLEKWQIYFSRIGYFLIVLNCLQLLLSFYLIKSFVDLIKG